MYCFIELFTMKKKNKSLRMVINGMYLHRLRIDTDPPFPNSIHVNIPEYYQLSIVILSSRTRLYLCTLAAAVAQLFDLRAPRILRDVYYGPLYRWARFSLFYYYYYCCCKPQVITWCVKRCKARRHIRKRFFIWVFL